MVFADGQSNGVI